MGYTKNVALLKGVKPGFSGDGGALSGIVKAEKYSTSLRVEISLINFAPLTEGRYVGVISDGVNFEIVEHCLFEGTSPVDTSGGFGAGVCFVNGSVKLIATAVCGDHGNVLPLLKPFVERAEGLKGTPQTKQNPPERQEYEDEAIAEVNYYDFSTADEGGEPVRQTAQKAQNGAELCEDEEGAGHVEELPSEVNKNPGDAPLARGGFYQKMKAEIEGLLEAYPPCRELVEATGGEKWVKISYGDGAFYVFGVLTLEGVPRYICYGVPAESQAEPPEGMRGLAAFLPVKNEQGTGFWVMYQDAFTGAAVKAEKG